MCRAGRARRPSLHFVARAEEFANEERCGIESGFFGEALGEREDVAFGQVKFHAFEAVHGEENDSGGEGLSILDLQSKVVERRNIDAAQADAFSGKLEDRSPEFFARIRQRRNYERAGAKWDGSLGFLVEACTRHVAIVVWEGI